MALQPNDWQAINRCLLRLYRELDGQRQPRVMLELLNELVPADSSAVNIFTPPDRLRAIGFPKDYTEEEVAAVARYGHQSPLAAYYLATQDASWKMTADFMPVEEFHKLDFYRFGLKPLGISQQMGGILTIMDGTAHVITLHRSCGFTEREREILDTMQPHLVTSYINAMVCSRAHHSAAQIKSAMETAPGAYGYFEASGKLAWLQEKAKAWLMEFFPEEVRHDGFVPHRVHQLLTESKLKENAPQQMTQKRGDEVIIACLGASPVGGWVLRLERKPATPPPRFQPLPQFSARKNEVLKWMAEGKRNCEIASILYLSPRTVEKHVADILAALQVENRACAIIRAMELCAAGKPNVFDS